MQILQENVHFVQNSITLLKILKNIVEKFSKYGFIWKKNELKNSYIFVPGS